jgi:hypothetical protein
MVFGGSKKKKEEVSTTGETVTNEDIVEDVDLTSTAFSMIKHPESGFALVTVRFNPITLQAKVDNVERIGDNRQDAEYHLKVKIGQYFAQQESQS